MIQQADRNNPRAAIPDGRGLQQITAAELPFR
jgi:hypothetical protein